MLCVALVAQIVDRPVRIHGDGGILVVCRLRPLDSADCNWRIETPINDVSAPLLDLRPGATIFVQGEFVAESREREGVRWCGFSLTADIGVIDRGPSPSKVALPRPGGDLDDARDRSGARWPAQWQGMDMQVSCA